MVLYGKNWPAGDPALVELEILNRKGIWQGVSLGPEHHHKQLTRLLWPNYWWTHWSDLLNQATCNSRILGIIGPASSGKTQWAATYALRRYWSDPENTLVICSTTTRTLLELRIWGEIKKYWERARRTRDWLYGTHLSGMQAITTDAMDRAGDIRDLRKGIIGLAARAGGQWQGLADFSGIKQKNLIMICDEAPLMRPGFFDAIPNLMANPGFQLIALGNLTEIVNEFADLCQPKSGWATLGPTEKSRVWENKFVNGRTVQLVGLDSPNLRYQKGAEPYSDLIGRDQIDQLKEKYGEESWQYRVMALGVIPMDTIVHRVISEWLCQRKEADKEPIWDSGTQPLRLYALDAACSGAGGDRTVGGEWWLGKCTDGKQRLARISHHVIPASHEKGDIEEQIVSHIADYCRGRGILPSAVYYDGTGRSRLTSAFAQQWSADVNPIEFGGRATDRPDPRTMGKLCKDSYGKFVSELWFAAAAAIEFDQIRGLTTDIIREGTMRVWEDCAWGRIDVENKDDMRKRLGESPDLFDMFVCAVEGARRNGFQIGLASRTATVYPQWLRKASQRQKEIERSKELAYA